MWTTTGPLTGSGRVEAQPESVGGAPILTLIRSLGSPDVTVDGARKTRRLAQACSRSAPTEASRFDTHELTGEETQRGDNPRYFSVKYPREFQSTAKPGIPRFREIDAGDTAKVGHN
jgi:hypothetical protein